MGRYLTKWQCDPRSDRALMFCTPHKPSRPGRQGQQQRGLSCLQPFVLQQGGPRGVNNALVVGVVVAVGGEGGAVRRFVELLVGVRSTMIRAGR